MDGYNSGVVLVVGEDIAAAIFVYLRAFSLSPRFWLLYIRCFTTSINYPT